MRLKGLILAIGLVVQMFCYPFNGQASMNKIYKLSDVEIAEFNARAKDGDIESTKKLVDYYLYYSYDLEKAVKYLRIIAKSGEPVACNNLAVALNSSTNREYQIESLYWFEEAAQKGNVNAQYELARIYEDGSVAKKDYCKAFHWYEALALNGDLQSIVKIATYYQEGKCVKVDEQKACYWWGKGYKLAGEKSHIAQKIFNQLEKRCREEVDEKGNKR